MERNRPLNADRIGFELEKIRQELEYLINATPTGENRNKLTEVNINLMEQVRNLRSIK